MRHTHQSHEMATIDRRLARERAYEMEILRLKNEIGRLRTFMGLVAKPIPPHVMLADDFLKECARELGIRLSLASNALRGAAPPKESPAETGPPLEGSENHGVPIPNGE